MIDFPLNLRDQKEHWTWFEGSEWLSLDRFERYWSDVGLALSNGEAVKSAVRAALGAKYAMDEEEEDDLDYMDHIKELAVGCFRSMNETAGTKDTQRVAAWLTGPVLAANKEAPWHCTWSLLLYRMAEEDPNTLMSHGIPGDTARKLIEIAVCYRSELDAIDERIEATDLEPLSGWDAVVYKVRRRENPEGSPLIGLSLLLRYRYFDRGWAEVLRCTRPAEIDALIRWGSTFKTGGRPYNATIPEDVRRTW